MPRHRTETKINYLPLIPVPILPRGRYRIRERKRWRESLSFLKRRLTHPKLDQLTGQGCVTGHWLLGVSTRRVDKLVEQLGSRPSRNRSR